MTDIPKTNLRKEGADAAPSNRDARREEDQKDTSAPQKDTLTRRGFLRGIGVMVTATGASALVSSCDPPAPVSSVLPTSARQTAVSDPDIITTAPTALGGPDTHFFIANPEHVEGSQLEFFRPHQARTVEAITARILPGDADDPGAREAGVVYFIDALLASGLGDGEPTFRQPPYAMGYDEDAPPTEAELNADFGVIWLPESELERYGYQSIMTPREAYRVGLAALDRYANDQFGDDFVNLSENDQDAIVEDLANGDAEGFDEPSAEDFFEMLREHTIDGMFSDPIYGGNRNMVGWRLVDYPGSQRGYTVAEMKAEGHQREPQSLLSLHHYHPGHTNEPNVVLPIQGSERR
jgi:gluconate 2-dehydrogenase gamma chain